MQTTAISALFNVEWGFRFTICWQPRALCVGCCSFLLSHATAWTGHRTDQTTMRGMGMLNCNHFHYKELTNVHKQKWKARTRRVSPI